MPITALIVYAQSIKFDTVISIKFDTVKSWWSIVYIKK